MNALRGSFSFAVSALTLCLISACSKKLLKEGSEVTGSGTVRTMGAPNLVNLAAVFDANTPRGFKTNTGLRLDADGDACSLQYGMNTLESLYCYTMIDIKNRFFMPSPTNIRDHLTSFDTRLNGTVSAMSEGYYPCMDASRTNSDTFTIDAAGGAVSTLFGPFSLVTIPLSSTFTDGSSFVTGKSIKLSCHSQNSSMDLAYGYDAGTWSLFERTSAQKQSQQGGAYGTVDSHDNMDFWFNLGDSTRDAAQSSAEISGASLYPTSTGIAHVIARPNESLTGIAIMGAGIGPGCGAQLLMNKTTLYFKGNINNYGSCTPADYNGTASSPDSTAVVSMKARESVEVCMVVSGDAPIPAPNGMLDCLASGLITKGDDGTIQEPFTAAGLSYITADRASPVANAIKGRAWMGSFFMQEKDLSAINLLGKAQLPADEKVIISGASGAMSPFLADAEIANNSVKAACNAGDSSKISSFSQSFSMDFSSIIETMKSQGVSEKTMTGSEKPITDTELLESLISDFANTNELAPYVEVPFSRTKGTTFQGVLSATVDLKLGNTSLGSSIASLAASASSNETLVKIPLSLLVPTAPAKLTLSVTGSITLACDNAISTERTVAAKVGMPRLVWFHQQEAADSEKK